MLTLSLLVNTKAGCCLNEIDDRFDQVECEFQQSHIICGQIAK